VEIRELNRHQHLVHIHLIQFQVIDINGVAQDPSMHCWKDVLVAPPNGYMTVIARFQGTLANIFSTATIWNTKISGWWRIEIMP
jgi:FtsP/CotA-like multicopper oxidase with cupredoxin domain